MAALRHAAPDLATRRAWAFAGLLPLGYGHQLAALWPGRGIPTRRAPALGLAAFASAALGLGWLLTRSAAAPLLGLLAAVAVWHVVENEVALARAGTRGGSLRLPALSRAPGRHVWTLLWTLALLAAAFSLPRLAPLALRWGVGARWVIWTSEELVAAVLLHHVVSFLVLGLTSGRGVGRRPGRRWRIVCLHLLPLAAGLACQSGWPALFGVLASPPLFLLCSVAHAVQTVRSRGAAAT